MNPPAFPSREDRLSDVARASEPDRVLPIQTDAGPQAPGVESQTSPSVVGRVPI
jgi:hypothetical protein